MIKVKSVVQKKPYTGGNPTADILGVSESTLDEDSLQDGGIIVQNLVFSVDPVTLHYLAKPETFKEDAPMSGFIAGKVIASKSKSWKVGDFVGAHTLYATHVLLQREQLQAMWIWKLTDFVDETNIEEAAGTFNLTGATAFAGIVDTLEVKEGDTVFISAASGAVGSIAGQIAKLKGAKFVIGSAGGAKKCEALTTWFGYDFAIDYKAFKTKEEFSQKLKEIAPNGIDKYFENVGGIQFDAALENMREKGRIAICGFISGYTSTAEQSIAKFNAMEVITKLIRIEGFNAVDAVSGKNAGGYFAEHLSKWSKDGKIISKGKAVDGIENYGSALVSLFTGSTHIGKLSVRI